MAVSRLAAPNGFKCWKYSVKGSRDALAESQPPQWERGGDLNQRRGDDERRGGDRGEGGGAGQHCQPFEAPPASMAPAEPSLMLRNKRGKGTIAED